MHNLAAVAPDAAHAAALRWRPRRGVVRPPVVAPAPAVEPIVRLAAAPDVAQIAALVTGFAAQGLMLPRTDDDVLRELQNYVVAATPGGRVLACAALAEYSPSLAEVSSVAVAADAHGRGLGSRVVLAVERVARLRDLDEVFALSLSPRFFLSLGYEDVPLATYPEKVARYDRMRASGQTVVEKGCFRKVLR
ncbi:MAG: GNAT family N-acetyltransferase [Gemmatimonadaceae bacterium]|jgi:amino-acid N-acetyltransferase|nr:GNAT family N-acetyltransferase [Gemmatimonadaceae bacterium]